MHCLGAVAGGSSSGLSSSGSRGGVLSVVRALGVLVCEGRIQGSPRGYKEGLHCAAPQQSAPNHHVCEKDDYLCNRYLVLVTEIADRIASGANLCVEVFMCCECPCGRATAICNNPVSPIPSTSITQWQNSCEMLLEYWRIGVVPSKSSEMMNSQGLYQAVRSRLHFSQVAAWWSRSKGTKPAYIATRVVPCNADSLSKFRETPVEHTFPLASIGDGNSVEVTVWALPRMEDVPTLTCPIHLAKDVKEEDSCTARALTPTKSIVSSCTSDASLVLPALVDDRLQTPCNQPGKHHCRCEDEDGCPPSPAIKPNGERKRRRSLPCGPPDVGLYSNYGNLPLASVSEKNPSTDIVEAGRNFRDREKRLESSFGFDNRAYLNTGVLEHCFRTQVSLEGLDGNEEKRYKPSSATLTTESETFVNCVADSDNLKYFVPFIESQWLPVSHHNGERKLESDSQEKTLARDDAVRLHHRLPVPREPNLVINPFAERSSFHESNPGPSTLATQLRNNSSPTPVHCTVHLNKSNEGSVSCRLERKEVTKNGNGGGKDLSQLMSKLSFPKESVGRGQKEGGGILNWISKVPGRVLSSSPNSGNHLDGDETQAKDIESQQHLKRPNSNGVKFKNNNLELSPREFDEVLAVLKARTPSGRRRTPVKTLRRRERSEKTSEDSSGHKVSLKNSSFNGTVCPIHREIQRLTTSEESSLCQACKVSTMLKATNSGTKQPGKSGDCLQNVSNKADVLLGAILRTSHDRKGLKDISNGTRSRVNSSNIIDDDSKTVINDEPSESRIIPFEDEKFLPSVLNKRLNRFKQLFKKEHEKEETMDTVNRRECYVELNPVKDSRVKRKFDFSNSEQVYEQLVNETSNKLQSNTHFYSTNKKLEVFNSDNEASRRDSPMSFVGHGNKDRRDNAIAIDEDDEETDEECLKISKKSVVESGNFTEEETADRGVPSAIEQERFRRSLENAASMVFHSRTGLPLTSSPAPLRRGSCCFDYDSSLNSVSSKRSALFELNTPPSPGAVSLEEADREVEFIGEGDEPLKRSSSSRSRPQSHALLGNFEESALNGRLEPVSTVHGFTAEIGASGTFCPNHRKLPVTVFFYTLGDNDKVSTPYLAHLNLGKKGYQVPRSGTIQVTLLNPLGTVVKMFVVLYDLSDMPPRSHTFLRQRTLRDKALRYLIHLRFMSGKSGRIYLHTDIRIIICRKSDVDTASDFASESSKELRSYIHGPSNPKFSPRC